MLLSACFAAVVAFCCAVVLAFLTSLGLDVLFGLGGEHIGNWNLLIVAVWTIVLSPLVWRYVKWMEGAQE